MSMKSDKEAKESKEILIKTIKDWVKVDNEMRELQKQQLIRKTEKKRISEILIGIMRKNEIDCFDTILSKYYKGDSSKAEDMQNFILDNREEEVKESITRIVT